MILLKLRIGWRALTNLNNSRFKATMAITKKALSRIETRLLRNLLGYRIKPKPFLMIVFSYIDT